MCLLSLLVLFPLLSSPVGSKTRKWELRDLSGFVIEFAKDQHGSRFIQQKLEVRNSVPEINCCLLYCGLCVALWCVFI